MFFTDLDRLLQGPHRLDGAVLNIAEKEPQKEIPLDQRKLCVSGLSEKTTEDGLELYLERLSNNNRVEQINRGYGDNVLVQFREDISKLIKIAKRLFYMFIKVPMKRNCFFVFSGL